MSRAGEIHAQLDVAVAEGDWGAGVAALARLTLSTGKQGETLQSTKVLDYDGQYDELDVNAGVHFGQPDMDHGARVVLSHDNWAQLGHPKHITVTVVAGDELNG